MKIPFAKSSSNEGSVLLVTLLVAAITGVALASYLVLTETQNVSVVRSQVWNSSMALTEAGIEDGLQLINKFASSGDARDLPKWTNYISAENWETLAPNVYYVKRYLPGSGTLTNSYEVWVTNNTGIGVGPTITSVGDVPWTYWYARGSAPIFATGGQQLPVPIPRKVNVQTRYDSLFAVAMAAVSTIDLKGNNIATDSFDSGDPNHNSSGLYPLLQPWKTMANGDVCTDASIISSLNVGNANIKGSVKTGPGTNTMSIGPIGSVGDKAWVEGGTKGIKPGHSSTDFNIAFEPPKLPENATWLDAVLVDTNIDGTHYDYVITTDGDYVIPSLSSSMLISAPSNEIVNIRITGDVNLLGSDSITIANTGAKVRIYMEGETFSLGGSAWIDNQTKHAENFYLFGMETCHAINFGGNGEFYGGIYAPTADFALGGGGSTTYDFVGGSVSRTVSMNGHFRFHYDENLRRVGPSKGYVPVSWRET